MVYGKDSESLNLEIRKSSGLDKKEKEALLKDRIIPGIKMISIHPKNTNLKFKLFSNKIPQKRVPGVMKIYSSPRKD